MYDNGLKNGSGIIWYDNGNKREESKYKDDTLISKNHCTEDGLNSGEFIRFFHTGDINTVANYLDGKLEGTYVFYDMDGKKYWERLHRDNQLMNERSYIGIKGPFRLN